MDCYMSSNWQMRIGTYGNFTFTLCSYRIANRHLSITTHQKVHSQEKRRLLHGFKLAHGISHMGGRDTDFYSTERIRSDKLRRDKHEFLIHLCMCFNQVSNKPVVYNIHHRTYS